MEEKKNQVVYSDSEEAIKTKKKDRSIWKKAGGALAAIGALAVIIIKDMNKK